VVTASAVELPDGSIELCPPGMTGPCPGILLDGEIDPILLSTDGSPTIIQATGSYDGRSLKVESDPVGIDYPLMAEPDFSSLCPDLEPLAIPYDEALTTAVSGYTTGNPDYAVMWWNEDGSALTVWFKGDDMTAHQEALDAVVDGKPVCVAGGAQFSEEELAEASQLLNGMLWTEGGPLVTGGYGYGSRTNFIELSVEAIDQPTRDALSELVGERVVPYPYIEVLDATLDDLPEPITVTQGDVEIMTSDVRLGGGMAALGTFKLGYDPDLRCFYFGTEGSTERTVPMWPFGYAATSDPLTVYDYDGNPVASAGDTLELGGGSVGVSGVEGNLCGATDTWIVSE
jgi:hypothetical protein